MARLAVGMVFGIVVGVIGGAALQTHAANEGGMGAESDLTGTDGSDQAASAADVVPDLTVEAPRAQQSAPEYGAAVMSRVACLEQKESGGANVANRRGSGAVGVLQYMPSTFAAHASEIGHPEWSPWNPPQARLVAAHDLVMGRRAQWSVSGC